MADDLEKLRAILEANKAKSFVGRILNYQNAPRLDLGEGRYATHEMAWGESDGKYVVYPTVLLNKGGQLEKFEPPKAWEHVRQTGNFIPFDSPEEAEWFSKNYKLIWPSNMR